MSTPADIAYYEAIEDLGSLISNNGGEAYPALDVVQDYVADLRRALGEALEKLAGS